MADTLVVRPEWLKVRFPASKRFEEIKGLLRQHSLHSVCEEADCPNIGECFSNGEATFIILGDKCTRSCGFCSVTSGKPNGLDLLEPIRLARTIKLLGLDYAVITSVNRDDLPDGGASVWAATIRAIRHSVPRCAVEVLTPDFEGNWEALGKVVEAEPDVYNHNIETVPRLYRTVRPKAAYERSLKFLSRVKEYNPLMTTKSGIMVGLGESMDEVLATMQDLRDHGVDLLTVGQYLQPDSRHIPVTRYLELGEYDMFREAGRRLGFRHVEAGPLVRSSYHAAEQARAATIARGDHF